MMENPQMDIESRDLIQTSDAPTTEHFPELEDIDSVAEPVISAAEAVSSLQAVHDVPVTVQAVLGRARIAIGALMQLKANAVIELDRRVGEPVDIFVNNRLIARGEVVLIENTLGVTLTEIVRQER